MSVHHLNAFPLRYISRANPRDNSRHVILNTATMRPSEFAVQLNVSLANGWGIVRTIVDLCLKHPEGKYVLIKDPNKVCSNDLSYFKWLSRLFSPWYDYTRYHLMPLQKMTITRKTVYTMKMSNKCPIKVLVIQGPTDLSILRLELRSRTVSLRIILRFYLSVDKYNGNLA